MNDQSRAINYAMAGWLAMVIDLPGQGERLHTGHAGTLSITTAGMTLAGIEVWDAMRAVDYLLTRPEVDPKRLVVSGASDGGMIALYAAALDERVTACVPAVSVSTLRGQVFAPTGLGCECRCIPGLMRDGLDPAVVAGLIAPRRILQINDVGDGVHPIRESRATSARLTRFAAAIGHADRYQYAEVRSRRNAHAFHGLARSEVFERMDQWFTDRPDTVPHSEVEPPLEMEENLYVLPLGRVPADSGDHRLAGLRAGESPGGGHPRAGLRRRPRRAPHAPARQRPRRLARPSRRSTPATPPPIRKAPSSANPSLSPASRAWSSPRRIDRLLTENRAGRLPGGAA